MSQKYSQRYSQSEVQSNKQRYSQSGIQSDRQSEVHLTWPWRVGCFDDDVSNLKHLRRQEKVHIDRRSLNNVKVGVVLLSPGRRGDSRSGCCMSPV